MKLNEIFNVLSNDGIFKALYSKGVSWIENESEAVSLDYQYFLNRSGDKTASRIVSKLYTPETYDNLLDTISKILLKMYGDNWERLYMAISQEYNPIENYKMIEEYSPNITRIETPNITIQDNNKVNTKSKVSNDIVGNNKTYGFNSPDSVDSDETLSNSNQIVEGSKDDNYSEGLRTESGTRTSTETGTNKTTRSGNIGVTTSQQMLESEFNLRKKVFINQIFIELDEVITLPYYEREEI